MARVIEFRSSSCLKGHPFSLTTIIIIIVSSPRYLCCLSMQHVRWQVVCSLLLLLRLELYQFSGSLWEVESAAEVSSVGLEVTG